MSPPGCRITPNRSKRYTTKQQYKIIDEFLLKHPKILNRIWTKRLNGYQRTEVNKLWAILKNRLNAHGPPERNVEGWKSVLVQRRHQQKRYSKNTETLHETSCAAIQPALQIQPEPNEHCNNDDGVFGIIEPDLVPETSQNVTTMSTISQDNPRGLRKLRSKSKPSKQQLEHLDEFILKHPNLDDFLRKQGYQWKLLRDRLNNRGPARSSKEWITLWTMRKELVQNMETQQGTSCAAKQSAIEPDEFNVNSCSNNDGVFDIVVEPDLVPETSQNDKNMTTISQDELHIKNELYEENVDEDSHELDEECVYEDSFELDEVNNVYQDFHPTNSDEFHTQAQPEQQCQKCRCCCSSRTRSNEFFEKQFEMQTKFMQNLTEQREHFHINILKILEENNKLLKENLRQKKEENDAREVKAEELRLKKIELKIMKAINNVKIKKLNL